MTLGIFFLGVLAVGGVARVVFLNSEVKALKVAMKKFYVIATSDPVTSGKTSTEIEEAQTEYEWLKNTTDLKKEVRLVWVTGTIIVIFFCFLANYFG